jgi:hypothetical protein
MRNFEVVCIPTFVTLVAVEAAILSRIRHNIMQHMELNSPIDSGDYQDHFIVLDLLEETLVETFSLHR